MSLAELDALWAERHVPDQLTAFGTALQNERENAPGDSELMWRAARYSQFLGMQHEGEKERREIARLFSLGRNEAERALKTEPDSVGGLFWAGACGLEAARMVGPRAALKSLPGARRRLERAAELDGSFHYAGPLRVLGRLAHHTPRWLGGNLDEALALYQQALQMAPAHPTTMLYFAEALATRGESREARKVLEALIAAPPFPDWIWEQERDRARARSIVARLAG